MKESKLATYLAQLPYTVGHQFGEQHVVVGAYDSKMSTLVHAVIDWNDNSGDDHEIADQNSAYLESALRKHPVARLIVTAYGPDGPARSRGTAAALEKAFDVRALQIHVHNGYARVRTTTTGQWGQAVPVTGFLAPAALDGHPAPVTSRTELLESVTPLPTPLFGQLDAAQATKVRGSSPLLQAEIAQRALDKLATNRVDDLEQMTVLSHLITAESFARDTVLVHAINDHDELMDARTGALVRTFRAAPPDQRPQLATIAAAATFLAAWHLPIDRPRPAAPRRQGRGTHLARLPSDPARNRPAPHAPSPDTSDRAGSRRGRDGLGCSALRGKACQWQDVDGSPNTAVAICAPVEPCSLRSGSGHTRAVDRTLPSLQTPGTLFRCAHRTFALITGHGA